MRFRGLLLAIGLAGTAFVAGGCRRDRPAPTTPSPAPREARPLAPRPELTPPPPGLGVRDDDVIIPGCADVRPRVPDTPPTDAPETLDTAVAPVAPIAPDAP
jgi:hypothetical protein